MTLNKPKSKIGKTENKQKTRLSDKQKAFLKSLSGRHLQKVLYHYWGYKDDPKFSLDWIELIFTDKSNLCFTSGSIAQNIEIVEFDLEKERKRIDTAFEGEVIITSFDNSDSHEWRSFINKQIIGCRVVVFTEPFWGTFDNSVILDFKENSIEIFAGIDNVNSKIFESSNREFPDEKIIKL
jgi:hypothetical protein